MPARMRSRRRGASWLSSGVAAGGTRRFEYAMLNQNEPMVYSMMALLGLKSEQFRKYLKILIMNCIGVALMLVAETIVATIATGSTALAGNEIIGVVNFLLTIFGVACVIAIIIAGVYLIISVDESYRDRAKQVIIGTTIALVTILASYTLIATFT